MTSKEYWQKRETEHAKKNKMSEQTYAEEIRKTYAYMADQIQKEIDGFYAKYANAEKISLAEAKRRVSKLDIEEYGRKAAKYVKEKDFSDQANEEMRLYNATMKINRLELLKANIGLEMVSGFDELQKYFDRTLTQQTIEEFRRQAGILGNSVQENGKMARAIVDASFHNATYSDRIWMYQDMLKAELDKLLKTGLIQGKNPRELAVHLQKRFGASREDAERLMVTELARVQTEAQKQSYLRNGRGRTRRRCIRGVTAPRQPMKTVQNMRNGWTFWSRVVPQKNGKHRKTERQDIKTTKEYSKHWMADQRGETLSNLEIS